MSLTPSEEFVSRLCTRTFLSPWTLANPRGKDAQKELCDLLIVCDPDVVIVSVKEIRHKATDDYETGAQRWKARAIDASTKQIYGAERELSRIDRVTAKDGSAWLHLPPANTRRIHRIAVAFGSDGTIPIADVNLGKGFVHVFDETDTFIVLTELDTITDFVDFLNRTEAFFEKTQTITSGTKDLLGLYLQTGRKYPDDADLLILVDDIWKELATRDEFKRRKEAEAESYFWDSLIEYIANERDDSLTRSFGGHQGASATWEQVVRTMARENRFNRRLLSNAFAEFHKGRRSRARIVVSPSGVVYTFLATPKGTDRSHRGDELLGRMFIARGLNLYATTVVGLATEEYDSNGGFSLDSALYYKPEWTEQDSEQMLSMQQATGAFQKVQWTKEHFDEYPPARPADA